VDAEAEKGMEKLGAELGVMREKMSDKCTGDARGVRVETRTEMLVACAGGISRKNAQENKRKINIEEQKGRQSNYLIAN